MLQESLSFYSDFISGTVELYINQRHLKSQKIHCIIPVGPEQIKLPTIENEVNELADKFLETN